MRIKHKGLRALHGQDNPARLPAETAARLSVARQALSRLLNGHCGVTPVMALALEQVGWSSADYWMRMQAGYDLAQERRRRAAA